MADDVVSGFILLKYILYFENIPCDFSWFIFNGETKLELDFISLK